MPMIAVHVTSRRGASVDQTRRAQGDRPKLRSIRPTRARTPFDASVDPTEARNG